MKFYTVADVAERLNVARSTVYDLVQDGLLECYRIGTGRGTLRFTDEQITDYLERARSRPIGETFKYL